jgi:SAM-dependent methyltransferase
MDLASSLYVPNRTYYDDPLPSDGDQNRKPDKGARSSHPRRSNSTSNVLYSWASRATGSKGSPDLRASSGRRAFFQSRPSVSEGPRAQSYDRPAPTLSLNFDSEVTKQSEAGLRRASFLSEVSSNDAANAGTGPHRPSISSSSSVAESTSSATPRASIDVRSSFRSHFNSWSATGTSSAALMSHNAPAMQADQDGLRPTTSKQSIPSYYTRTDSVSSASGQASLSARTLPSTDPSSPGDFSSRPFINKNGRTYLNESTLAYPLPTDLTELHRQCLRTLLLIQVFGAPVCSPNVMAKPPARVLEVGCGSGFWSMMCHRYFKGRGHGGIRFTGIDIAPIAPGSANIPTDSIKPDRDMNWEFVQHDLRQTPWPLPGGEFDLVMVKDMSLSSSAATHQCWMDEYIRLLRPGGVLEIWDSDSTIRMLRPHVPAPAANGSDAEEHEAASSLGAYVMTANTPLSAPLNTYLVEYNHWVTKALDAREASAIPCTFIGPYLVQEAESFAGIRSRRLAIPLSEMRWEREGVGGVVTKDGKTYVEMKKGKAAQDKLEKKTLTAGQAALRKTALLTVVQQIQAMEPMLREVSGKSLDEWDAWQGKMLADLMGENGTSWGECLEVGAWWAKRVESS